MFIDEIGASTKMVRLYGRAKQRCAAPIPHGHWLTTTFTAALRRTALPAMTLDGPMNAVSFRAYVEQVLAPTLRPGDIVLDYAANLRMVASTDRKNRVLRPPATKIPDASRARLKPKAIGAC